MTTTSIGTNMTLDPDAFLAAADQGDFVALQQRGSEVGVIGVGMTRAGRSVTWVDGGVPGALPAGMVTATAAFLDALQGTYGPRIYGIITESLELPQSGDALPSALVHRAVRLAKASQSLFAGANFMTRLRFSAMAGDDALAAACARIGMTGHELSAGRRLLADQLFAKAFKDASRNDTIQVSDGDAQALFDQALRRAVETDEA